jgi:transcriptional accessory protein Tex/SPT6
MPPKGRRQSPAIREWGHSEGFPLTEVSVDAEYDGIVTNVGPYGVFVNFGAMKDGLLKVPAKIGRGFKRGMEVSRLVVLSCDPDSGRVVLSPQDETQLPEPPPKRSSSRTGREGSRGPAKASKDTRRPREWGHDGQTPLEDLQEDDVWDGTITNVGPSGVFVDIGAVRDARLNVPAKIGRRFRVGDFIGDCRIESIDVANGRLSVTLDDPEEVVRDLPPKERPKAKAAPKAKSTPKAQAVATAPRRSSPPRAKAKPTQAKVSTIERLRVGQYVDGVVANKSQFGIFVDIGIGKDAKLQVPKRLMSRFRRKDEITGMRVESVDLEKVQVAVSIEDPELVEESAAQAPPLRSSPAAKKAAAKPKATAKPKAKAKGQQDWSHPNALPISSFKVGQTADGIVTNIGPQGVFVDINAVRDGVLQLPREIAKQFRVDDEVQDMTIEAVDLKTERITLVLEDPELKEPGPMSPPRKMLATRPEAKKANVAPASKAQAKAKPKAKAKGAGAESWSHDDGIPLEELVVGSETTGVVTNRGQFGVFLDIGAVKDGKLRLGRNEWRKFRKGDEVEYVVIEHVDMDTEQIALGLAYELDDAPVEYVEEAPVNSSARRPKAKPKAARQPSPGVSTGVATRPTRSAVATRPGTAKAQARRKA